MSNMAAIRAGIIANLQTLQDDGVEIDETTRLYNLYERPDKAPVLPAIMVIGLTDIDYTANPPNTATVELLIEAFVSDIGDNIGWWLLDPLLMGAKSIKKLVEADRTLGGAVDDAVVLRMNGERALPLVNTKFLGADWTVQIELSGT